jgi:hypothetical protein
MMPENNYYGHKLALSWYCGLQSPKPIFGSIPHGWALDLEYSNRKFPYAPIFVYNQRHLSQASQLGVRNVRCIGAPFTYLARTLWRDGSYPAGNGTLVFGSHSNEAMVETWSERDLVASVEQVCEPPYTVSVSYQDLNRSGTKVYRDAGWRVVSFGQRNQPSFLVELAFEIVRHESVVGNLMQSALMYGALLKRRTRVLGPKPDWMGSPYDPGKISQSLGRYPELHGVGLSSDEAGNLGKSELGWESNLPPLELARALGWTSRFRAYQALTISRGIDIIKGRQLRLGIDRHESQVSTPRSGQ